MSHTIRIYNRPVKKAKRVNIDAGEIVLMGGGIPFTKKSYICMGRCPECRDPKLETRAIRRKNKEELRYFIYQEFNSIEPTLSGIEIYGEQFF